MVMKTNCQKHPILYYKIPICFLEPFNSVGTGGKAE